MEIAPITGARDRHVPALVPRVERPHPVQGDVKAQVGDHRPDGKHTDGLAARAHVERDEITDTNIVRYRDRDTGEVLYQLPPKAVLEQIRMYVEQSRIQEENAT